MMDWNKLKKKKLIKKGMCIEEESLLYLSKEHPENFEEMCKDLDKGDVKTTK